MELEVYFANVQGKVNNTKYPNYLKTTDLNEFKEVTKNDYTFTEYQNRHRCKVDFIKSKYAVFDCDNTLSDNKEEWIDFKTCQELFRNVNFVYITSRNNWKQKGTKSPRPRFHIIFQIDEITVEKEFASFLIEVQKKYPFFDKDAIDTSRFFFGCSDSDITESKGSMNLTDFLKKVNELDKKFEDLYVSTNEIKEGSRNSTMSHLAGKILIKLGNTDQAYEAYINQSQRCDPPLEDSELETIWNSAKSFYKKVSSKVTYIKPEDYSGVRIWDNPLPLEKIDVPLFPVDALPDSVKSYVEEVSMLTQTPIDMAACSALVVLSLILQGKYKIQGKHDWIEPLNLFTLIITEPSERKSAVINAMTKPLYTYEDEYNKTHSSEIEKSKIRKRVLEAKKHSIEIKAAKGKATEEDIEDIANEIESFKELKPLKLFVDDVTPERLVSILQEDNGKAGIVSAEGGIF